MGKESDGIDGRLKRHTLLAQTARICPLCGLGLFSMLCWTDGRPPALIGRPNNWVCERCGKTDGIMPQFAKERGSAV